MKPKVSAKVSAEDFVKTWQKGSSIQQVAAELGMSFDAVKSRSYSYRRRGVKLRKYERENKFDVDALNKLCE